LVDDNEVHPDELVTLNVYVVLSVKPENKQEVVGPTPVVVALLGVAVTVHVPEDGIPLKATLPVAKEHVGCVIIPIIGAAGVVG